MLQSGPENARSQEQVVTVLVSPLGIWPEAYDPELDAGFAPAA